MKRVKTGLSGFLLIVLLLFPEGPAQSQAARGSQLFATYTAPAASMAPMWIAKEVGHFSKHGLDAKLIYISGPLGTTALLAGEVAIGVIGGLSPIRAAVAGAKDLRIIGQTKKYMVASIVGIPEIKDVQDLRGRRVGINRLGSNAEIYTSAGISRFGLDPRRDVKYIQVGDAITGLAALKSGAIDALTTVPPHNLFAAKAGFKTIVDITPLRIPFAATILVSTKRTLDEKTELLKKFMRGYAEAVHTFLTDPETTAKVISKYAKMEDREIVDYSVRSEAGVMERSLDIDRGGVEFVLNYLKKDFPQAASIDIENLLDRRLVNDLQESGFLKSLWKQ